MAVVVAVACVAHVGEKFWAETIEPSAPGQSAVDAHDEDDGGENGELEHHGSFPTSSSNLHNR